MNYDVDSSGRWLASGGDPKPCSRFIDDGLTRKCALCGWWRSTHENAPLPVQAAVERMKAWSAENGSWLAGLDDDDYLSLAAVALDVSLDEFETPPVLSSEARARLASPDAPKLRVNPGDVLHIDWAHDDQQPRAWAHRGPLVESGPFTAVPVPVAQHEALMAVLAGARALRAGGGTATALFAAVDAYDKAHGKADES